MVGPRPPGPGCPMDLDWSPPHPLPHLPSSRVREINGKRRNADTVQGFTFAYRHVGSTTSWPR